MKYVFNAKSKIYIFTKLVCTVKLPPSCLVSSRNGEKRLQSLVTIYPTSPTSYRTPWKTCIRSRRINRRDDVARYATLSTLPIESALKFRHSLCPGMSEFQTHSVFDVFLPVLVHVVIDTKSWCPDRISASVPIATFRKRVVARNDRKRISRLVVIQHPVYHSKQGRRRERLSLFPASKK